VLLLALARRTYLGGRNERRALADSREQLLEHACLVDLDRDVVDPAAVLVGTLPLNGDQRCERARRVGQQDVLVRRDDIEEGGDREQQAAGDDQELEETTHGLRIGGALEEEARETAVDRDHRSGDV
jgi:hypothetical protein